MTTSTMTPIAKGLFAETPAGPRLLGSKCATCETPYFPKATICRKPSCDNSQLEDAEFGPHGKLWGCTVQYYPPPPPAKYDEPYEPYAIALVDMAEGLRVLTRVSTDDPESVVVGSDVELVIEKLYTNPEGQEISTFKFRQTAGGASA